MIWRVYEQPLKGMHRTEITKQSLSMEKPKGGDSNDGTRNVPDINREGPIPSPPSATPETDALLGCLNQGHLYHPDNDMVDHARKLERERDELREETKKWRQKCRSANKGSERNAHINFQFAKEINTLKKDLDEARAIAEKQLAYSQEKNLDRVVWSLPWEGEEI